MVDECGLASVAAIPTFGSDHQSGDARDISVHSFEWPAFPAKLTRCLGRRRALELLDWQDEAGTSRGRLAHQDEYAEWRVGRDRSGHPRSIEITTEFPEHWEVLAGWAPELTLTQIAEFAGIAEVPAELVYGTTDPFDADTTPDQRIEAFRRQMLPAPGLAGTSPKSELNDGRRAITCMAHRANTLRSVVRLIAAASHGYAVRDAETGRTRYPSGTEAIGGMVLECTDGRNSDPLIVERVVRLATDGRRIGLVEPAGVYIRDVQLHEVAQPDGSDIPSDWLVYSRSTGTTGGEQPQRLKFSVPADAPFTLADLIVRRTQEPLRYGGQFAELVQVGLDARSEPEPPAPELAPAKPDTDPLNCSEEAASWAVFEATSQDRARSSR